MKKNIIIVTGGAGFVGSNLIKSLLLNSKLKIISLDNYFSGNKKNHSVHSRVKYIKGETKNFEKIFRSYKNKIHSVFHFGEFARIYQSFLKFDKCYESNIVGSKEVFSFCLKNKIKLIYSATSATIGNDGNDKDLSPYAFTKSKNLEFLENLKKWFNFKYEVVYFYNVYGQNHIRTGPMATVIGIFEHQFKNNKPVTVVKPGTQTRRFTHIDDTIKVCLEAWKKDKCRHYSISSREEHSILEIAKFFSKKIKFLPEKKGERYLSSLTDDYMSNKISKRYGKIKVSKYIQNFKKNKKQ